jgi:hypothetical protein
MKWPKWRITSARTLVLEHLSEPVRLEALARLAGLSRFHPVHAEQVLTGLIEKAIIAL